MPPQKQRAKTLQEKFGFVDEELKTPEHDAMMVWIDQQAKSLIEEYFSISSGWSADTIDRVRAEADQAAKSHFHKLQWTGLGEPPPIKLKILEKIWESPIVTKNGYAVGFADMEVIRKIRLYQEYRKGHYIVVSPDDKFADILRGQGIQFVKYET